MDTGVGKFKESYKFTWRSGTSMHKVVCMIMWYKSRRMRAIMLVLSKCGTLHNWQLEISEVLEDHMVAECLESYWVELHRREGKKLFCKYKNCSSFMQFCVGCILKRK